MTASAAMLPGIYADAVDALFVLTYGAGAGAYLTAWKGSYVVSEHVEIEDEIPIRYYTAGGDWVADLATALLDPAGCLSTVPCTQRLPYVG